MPGRDRHRDNAGRGVSAPVAVRAVLHQPRHALLVPQGVRGLPAQGDGPLCLVPLQEHPKRPPDPVRRPCPPPLLPPRPRRPHPQCSPRRALRRPGMRKAKRCEHGTISPTRVAPMQVCLEGEISRQTVANSLARGKAASGDLIPWTIAQQVLLSSNWLLPGCDWLTLVPPSSPMHSFRTASLHPCRVVASSASPRTRPTRRYALPLNAVTTETAEH